MQTTMIPKRNEIKTPDQWDLDSLFPSKDAWAKSLKQAVPSDHAPRWPKLNQCRGTLSKNSEAVRTTFDLLYSYERELHNLYVYAHCQHDVDLSNDEAKHAFGLISSALYNFSEETSWIEPELLSLPQKTLEEYLNDSNLTPYRFILDNIVRKKPHTLSQQEENLIALSGKALQGPQSVFRCINDADFQFPDVQDSKGNTHSLSHGLYALHLRSEDATLRKNAFQTYHQTFSSFENTLTELIQSNTQANVFYARAKKFSSCLEAALFKHNIDPEVYHNLIQTVHERLPSLHRYMKLRKKALGLSEQHLYDLYISLQSDLDLEIDYEKGVQRILESVEILGPEYQSTLKKGLLSERWVDRYENKNKRSGAYSSGSYDSHPYILMNYKGRLRDLFTLMHEAGHSMHSTLSNASQPYHLADYTIFVAEIASTFNEELLMNTLLKHAKSREERIFLLSQKLDDIRSTLFRQTQFAEFELQLHQWAEQQVPFTPKLLKETYQAMNATYFGSDVIIDPEIEIEWARIPHFYSSFYVYQYATGISAALSFSKEVLAGGEKERERYLDFLRGGGSDYPLELLQKAGLDMRTPTPIHEAIDVFDSLLDQLDKELD